MGLYGSITNRRSNAENAYDLMSDISAYILEEPKRIDMTDWVETDMEWIREQYETEGPVCGTVGCIAGNAVVLLGQPKRWVSAGMILGGGNSDLRGSLENLFMGTEVNADYGTEKYAEIVAGRIAKFQSEWGAELRAVVIENRQ